MKKKHKKKKHKNKKKKNQRPLSGYLDLDNHQQDQLKKHNNNKDKLVVNESISKVWVSFVILFFKLIEF